MKYIFPNNYYYTTTKNELNFCGAVRKYFEDICTKNKCSDETKNTYYNLYCNIIFKFINFEKPLIEYDDSYIDYLLTKIKSTNQISENTIESTYRHLLYDPYKYHAESCNNINTWGSAFKNKRLNSSAYSPCIIPKSLTERDNKVAINYLLENINCTGETIGLALMYYLGIRENEACGLDFDDIKKFEHYNCYYIIVGHKTTKINSNELKASGKTKNAPRKIPLPDQLYSFLLKRKAYIEDIEKTNADKFPIVCYKNQYNKRSTTSYLSIEGKCFFKNILQIKENIISSISSDLLIENKVDMSFYEKEPTTYLLRRNFATHLYLADVTLERSQYLMGHEIQNSILRRSDFIDERILYNLYLKINSMYNIYKTL